MSAAALTAESLRMAAVSIQRKRGNPARSSLMAFNRAMYPAYIGGAHIDRLIAALEAVERGEITRLIVTMPPRHSKSFNVSESFPAWFLGRNPDKRIIASSHTAQLSYTFSRRVRAKLTHPAWPFPEIRVAPDKAGVTAWDVSRHRGGYLSVGVGGSPTGHGADLIVIDDPIRSAADADSETIRDGLWEWYQGTLRTRLQPGGSIILTATRWHHDDLTGRLLAEMEQGGEQWVHLHMPAVDEAGAPLWPEYWPLDALEKVRSSVGSRVWQSQYLGAPTPSEGGILKRHWFGQFAAVPPSAFLTIQSWDTAFQTGDSNDYSACSTLSEGVTGTFLRDVYRERLEFPDLERMVIQQYERMRPSAVLIENKASGQSLIQSLRRKTSIPIIAVDVPNTKDWKTQRINELAPYVETGRFQLPIAASWLDDALHELTAFPFASHNDIADSVAQGLRWILQRNQGGGGTSSYLPDVDDDEDEDDRW